MLAVAAGAVGVGVGVGVVGLARVYMHTLCIHTWNIWKVLKLIFFQLCVLIIDCYSRARTHAHTHAHTHCRQPIQPTDADRRGQAAVGELTSYFLPLVNFLPLELICYL